jgi:glycosyltransferase involved in cell wall biosynthesis
MKKLLSINYRPPYKDGRSNSFGQYNIHQIFKEHFNVKGISFGFPKEAFDNFEIIPFEANNFRKVIKLILLGRSPRLTHFESLQFKKRLVELLNEYNPDFIYVEHTFMMQYLLNIKTRAKVIFFDDDSFLYSKEKNLEGNLFHKIRNFDLANYERKAIERADYIITITEEEKKKLDELGFDNVFNIPYGIDADYFSFNWKRPRENSLLFVGNFDHYPNREAVRFIIKNIYPEIKNLNCRLRIVGRNLKRIKKILPDDVEVYEDVPDIREYYWNSSVFFAPILSGAGLRIKILEAAACGIPIIMTPLANLGIHLLDDHEAAIVNNIAEMIDLIFNICREGTNITSATSIGARKNIESNFSIKVISETYNKILIEFL